MDIKNANKTKSGFQPVTLSVTLESFEELEAIREFTGLNFKMAREFEYEQKEYNNHLPENKMYTNGEIAIMRSHVNKFMHEIFSILNEGHPVRG